MLTSSAELHRPQSITPFQGFVWGSPPKGRPSAGMTASNAALYRLAAAAGLGSALVLLVNAA